MTVPLATEAVSDIARDALSIGSAELRVVDGEPVSMAASSTFTLRMIAQCGSSSIVVMCEEGSDRSIGEAAVRTVSTSCGSREGLREIMSRETAVTEG